MLHITMLQQNIWSRYKTSKIISILHFSSKTIMISLDLIENFATKRYMNEDETIISYTGRYLLKRESSNEMSAFFSRKKSCVSCARQHSSALKYPSFQQWHSIGREDMASTMTEVVASYLYEKQAGRGKKAKT